MKRIVLVLVAVVSLVAVVVWTTLSVEAAPITYSASAANAAGIQTTVDAFRTALGVLNPNVAESYNTSVSASFIDYREEPTLALQSRPEFFNVPRNSSTPSCLA